MRYQKNDPILDDDRFIEGIFNYCDRWCERCTMTRYCRVFALEALQEAERGKPMDDWTDEEYQEFLHGSVEESVDTIRTALEEAGIKLDLVDIESIPLD